MAESYLMAALLMCIACVIISCYPVALDIICPECQGDAWHLPAEAVGAIGYSVVFQTIIGYCAQEMQFRHRGHHRLELLLAWALRYAESSLVALYAVMQPITAAVMSCVLLSMGINPHNALAWPGREMRGAVLVIIGLMVAVPGGLSACAPRRCGRSQK